MASNSPFITSDLPKSNIIYVKKNLKTRDTEIFNNETQIETFGANIYDLYKNSFFMQGGFIGGFASKNIQNVLDILLDGKPGIEEKELLNVKSIIEIVGEPILRKKIAEIWDRKHGEKFGYISKRND